MFAEDKINNTDLPALYRAASAFSIKAQERHVLLARLELILSMIVVFFGAISFADISHRQIAAIFAAVFIGLAFLATLSSRIFRLDKIWYNGRAVAETVKSLTWKYMCRSEPFNCVDNAQSDRKFAEELRVLLEQSKGITFFGDYTGSQDQITHKMREIRNVTLNQRKQMYKFNRLDDQITWYANKSRINKRSMDKLFFFIILCQSIAFVSAIFMAVSPEVPFQLAGFFAALGTTLFAWLQLKQHQLLAQSYAVASHDLSLIAANFENIGSEADLSSLVEQAEGAISREHKLWLTHREAC